MLIVPASDIMKIGILIGLLGAFVLAKNYFPLSVEQVALEGRLQFGGSSFEMKDKIITKYNAWVGFGLVVLSVIIQFVALNLDKYTTFADLKGRSVLFGSGFNITATIAALILLTRITVFATDIGARHEYFPFLKEREKNNFENDIQKLNDKNADVVKDAQKGIDQQMALFDIKPQKRWSYEDKIRKLKEDVYK